MRAPWNGFPEAAVHSSIYKLKSLPGYHAAKKGDHRAATRIAAALINPTRLNISIDYVVPVIQVDAGHYNAIPVAFAALLAKRLGARLWLDVFQINKVNHTAADGIDRLKQQPIFDGSTPNGTCIICDDVVTYGATLANLRGFLIAAGTKVIAATVIGAAYGSTKLAPDHILTENLQRRYGPELERYTTPLGFRSECLTAREAYFLKGIRTLDRLRACFAQEIGSTDRSRGVRCRI
ncbi:MAG: phosphoribosyltransferase [Verrucomicrobiales bacterium]|nr:phosphoribosyltransferase [Verrucomicrobiales bacterium]